MRHMQQAQVAEEEGGGMCRGGAPSVGVAAWSPVKQFVSIGFFCLRHKQRHAVHARCLCACPSSLFLALLVPAECLHASCAMPEFSQGPRAGVPVDSRYGCPQAHCTGGVVAAA